MVKHSGILAVAFWWSRGLGNKGTLSALGVSSAPFPFSICVYSNPCLAFPELGVSRRRGQRSGVEGRCDACGGDYGLRVVLGVRGDGYIYSVHMLEACQC